MTEYETYSSIHIYIYMNINNLTVKEKLQIIGSKIMKYKSEMAQAQMENDYETYKLKRGAIEMANQEFKRLAKQYKKT